MSGYYFCSSATAAKLVQPHRDSHKGQGSKMYSAFALDAAGVLYSKVALLRRRVFRLADVEWYSAVHMAPHIGHPGRSFPCLLLHTVLGYFSGRTISEGLTCSNCDCHRRLLCIHHVRHNPSAGSNQGNYPLISPCAYHQLQLYFAEFGIGLALGASDGK